MPSSVRTLNLDENAMCLPIFCLNQIPRNPYLNSQQQSNTVKTTISNLYFLTSSARALFSVKYSKRPKLENA